MRLCRNSVGFCDRNTQCTLSPAIFSFFRFGRFVLSFIPLVFPARLLLASGEPSWQELGTDSGNNIAAAGKVEDVAAADTLKDVIACSVTVDAGDIEAADVELFE
jgi:hypothetical protein